MSSKVLIVESPSKAKSIQNYVKGTTVLATYGHVRDLLAKDGAVDTQHSFAMQYVLIERNKQHVDAIVKAVKKADTVLLATDPDREGEAIAWHVLEALKEKKALKDKKVARVVFHQVTKKAVLAALDQAREISMDLVYAQQARRALDFLVGFNLSPLLWKKVRPGLSAGRVQSPALRMINAREAEIKAFVKKEYWSVEAQCQQDGTAFTANLTHYQQDKLHQFSLVTAEQTDKVIDAIKAKAKGQLTVTEVVKKARRRQPPPPFTTSTLQQEASKKFRFGTSKTMRIAQQLYEGVKVGQEQVGLITYMRTDSVSIGQDAIAAIRDYVEKHYGPQYLPDSIRQFKTKSKNAQEAHEAIRPTSVTLSPDTLKSALDADQMKLYSLIWSRAIASQMQHAVYDAMAIVFDGGGVSTFKTTGSTLKEAGFLKVYMEATDETQNTKKDATQGKDQACPPLKVGDCVPYKGIVGHQHFTEPPPRYSEASLVKALEEHGIGRPSTYASIISTLLSREYVTLLERRFHTTDVGETVGYFLTEYFETYVNYNFTAGLEDELDAIARGEQDWVAVMQKFWDHFHTQVDKIDETVSRADVTSQTLDEACPECGKPLTLKLGRRGKFIGCSGYPECRYTRSADETAEEHAQAQKDEVIDRPCPLCESDLVVKSGRYGKFIGCSAYPKCKHIEPLEQPKTTEVTCPKCNKGQIAQRRSKRGKIFFSCNRYPDCKYAIWNEPIVKACDACQWPIMTVKVTKRYGTQHVCPECKNTVNIAPPESKES